MNKGFLNKDYSIFDLDIGRKVIGILIGVFYAITFYFFAYMCRESIRVISFDEHYYLWIFSTNETNFYNLFFAYLATIFGQSRCLIFWIDQHKRFQKRDLFTRATFVNDQTIMNQYFLSWFSELALCYGILYAVFFRNGYLTFSFYPDYNYIFILIIIVLFLQSWNTIRLVNKKKSKQWMLISIIVISIFSFSLSRINLVNYKAINNIFKSRNLMMKYDYHPPISTVHKKLGPVIAKNIYIVQDFPEPRIIKKNEIISIKEITKEEEGEMYILHSNYRDRYTLRIDRNVKMDIVYAVQTELINIGVKQVAYAVIPPIRAYDDRFFFNNVFYSNLKIVNNSNPTVKKRLAAEKKYLEIIAVDSNQYCVNNEQIHSSKLRETISSLVSYNHYRVISFTVNQNTSFKDYLFVLTTTSGIIEKNLDVLSIDSFGRPYKNLNRIEKKEVREKFEFFIYEFIM